MPLASYPDAAWINSSENTGAHNYFPNLIVRPSSGLRLVRARTPAPPLTSRNAWLLTAWPLSDSIGDRHDEPPDKNR